jgi:hypothetical protein
MIKGNLSINPTSRRITVQLENGKGCISENKQGYTEIQSTYRAWCGTCNEETEHQGVRCKECRR